MEYQHIKFKVWYNALGYKLSPRHSHIIIIYIECKGNLNKPQQQITFYENILTKNSLIIKMLIPRNHQANPIET